MTARALATRIVGWLVLFLVLLGGAIGLALSRSSSAGEKATTSRSVNVRQETKIERNTRRLEREARKLNATLECLGTNPEPLKCVRKIGVGRSRVRGVAGATGLRGGRGAAGTRGGAGLPGERGEPGAEGPPGLPGVGVKGDKGDPGRDGVDGLDGADGRQGPQGPRGSAPAQIQTACPGPDGTFIEGFATDPDGDLMYSCP